MGNVGGILCVPSKQSFYSKHGHNGRTVLNGNLKAFIKAKHAITYKVSNDIFKIFCENTVLKLEYLIQPPETDKK
jgi:hypothetical protein